MSSNKGYNWADYSVLHQGDLYEDQIIVRLEDSTRLTNLHIEKAIEQAWKAQEKGRIAVGLLSLRNTTVYRLNSYEEVENALSVSLSETTFRELQGTNATNWILGDIYGKDHLANGILVQSLVLTSDNQLVLGTRIDGTKEASETWAIFGGSFGKDEVDVITPGSIFKMMRLELREELGIIDDQLASVVFHALFEDWKYYPVFLFVSRLNISAEELENLFAKHVTDEHAGLVFKSLEEVLVVMEENEEKLSDLTLAAIDIYTKK